jgi:hypothetical protein
VRCCDLYGIAQCICNGEGVEKQIYFQLQLIAYW